MFFPPEFHLCHLPDFSDDEKQNATGQQQNVVGQVAVVDGAVHDAGLVFPGDDVEDTVLVRQRKKQNCDEHLKGNEKRIDRSLFLNFNFVNPRL